MSAQAASRRSRSRRVPASTRPSPLPCTIAAVVLGAVLPLCATAAPAERAAVRVQPPVTATTAAPAVRDASRHRRHGLSDIAAAMLLLSGCCAFLYARRRQAELHRQRDVVAPGAAPRPAHAESRRAGDVAANRHAPATRGAATDRTGNTAGSVDADPAGRHGRRRRVCDAAGPLATAAASHPQRMQPG